MKATVTRAHSLTILLALCLSVPLSSCSAKPASEPESRLELGRSIVKDFASQLQSELIDAIEAGGPVKAIGVCKVRAPEIAANLSNLSGATVMRTSARARNPASSPNGWQLEGLQTLPSREPVNQEGGEYYTVTADGASHYLKAIYMKPLCLACHGKSLSGDVKAALEESYPEDQATGYEAGELRGAFSISWP